MQAKNDLFCMKAKCLYVWVDYWRAHVKHCVALN